MEEDLDAMRVVDLQAECRKRGLDHRGRKTDLVERLKSTSLESRDQTSLKSFDVSRENEDKRTNEDGGSQDNTESSENKRDSEEKGNEDKTGDSRQSSNRKRHDRSSPNLRDGHAPNSKSRSPPARRRRASSSECVIPEIITYGSIDNSRMFLNHHNSHLNVVLADDCLSAGVLTEDGLSAVWGCVTSSHYIPLTEKRLKVGFTVKLVDQQKSRDESDLFDFRVGWSLDDGCSSLILGEQPGISYAYCSDGKKVSKSELEDYSDSFTFGDVITCLSTIEENSVLIQFAKNGQLISTNAFTIETENLNSSQLRLYPQIALKNCNFEVNFGQVTEGVELTEGFKWIDSCESKVLSCVGSDNKNDYEIVMMIGLPGSGKTFQTSKLVEENAEKQYWVMNANYISNQMKIKGKEPVEAISDNLKDIASRYFNRLLQIAPSRPRNYIIDRSNIYRDLQRKRLAVFKGFHRKVVVVVPDDTTYQQRLLKHEHIPNTVLEMKASISLPGMEDVDEILYAELDADDARVLLTKYNREAASSKRRADKSPHRNDRYSRRSPRSYRDQRQSSVQRRRFNRERDWRGDISSRLESNRFSDRRMNRVSQSPFNSGGTGGSYDYGRWYGSTNQKMSTFGGNQSNNYYGRQRRSMTPPSRQMNRGSWDYSGSQSGSSYRQDQLLGQSGSSQGNYGSRGLGGISGQSSSPSSRAASFTSPKSFDAQLLRSGTNQQQSPNTPNTPTNQWNRTPVRNLSQSRNQSIVQNSNEGSVSNTAALLQEASKQTRQLENWHLSGKRDNSQSSDYWQSKQNYEQRGSSCQGVRPQNQSQWSNNRSQWPSSRQLPGDSNQWQSQRGNIGQSSWSNTDRSKWVSQRENTGSQYPIERKGMLSENWSGGNRTPGVNDNQRWSSRRDDQWQSERSTDQTKWGNNQRSTEQWSSPQSTDFTNKTTSTSETRPDNSTSWSSSNQQSPNPVSTSSQKWNSPRASNATANQWNAQWSSSTRQPTPGESQPNQWMTPGSTRTGDQNTQWMAPNQYSSPLRPQDQSWRSSIKPGDSQAWSNRLPSTQSSAGFSSVRQPMQSDPNYPQRPYRMYPPQTNAKITNPSGGAYPQGWPQQTANNIRQPSSNVYSVDSSYPPRTPQPQSTQIRPQAYPQAYIRPAITATVNTPQTQVTTVQSVIPQNQWPIRTPVNMYTAQTAAQYSAQVMAGQRPQHYATVAAQASQQAAAYQTLQQQSMLAQYGQQPTATPTAGTWSMTPMKAATVPTATNPNQYGSVANASVTDTKSTLTAATPYQTNAAAYNYSNMYAAQQAAAAAAYGQQPAQTLQQQYAQQNATTPMSYQMTAGATHQSNYPAAQAAANAGTYPYATSSLTSITTSQSISTSTNQQVQGTTPTVTQTATTNQQAQQIIDEPTAYAGYLSAGYDQATAKAMATAYVQQQQQYYQWHQQWAAAAAAASNQSAGTTVSQASGTAASATPQK